MQYKLKLFIKANKGTAPGNRAQAELARILEEEAQKLLALAAKARGPYQQKAILRSILKKYPDTNAAVEAERQLGQ